MKLIELNNLNESIEDKGIFKAMFFGGGPGAGKSTVSQKIADGTINPRIVNTDKGYEFLLKKAGMNSTDPDTWQLFGKKAKTITKQLLFHYINGMLPLSVDGTSSSPSLVLKRRGLLESLGYDTTMVWIDTSLETSIERIQSRERKVDPDFVRKIHNTANEVKQFLQNQFGSNFIIVSNEGDDFEKLEQQTYNYASRFFNSTVQNFIGKQNLNKLHETNSKYLIPTVINENYLNNMISVWFNRG